MQKNICSEGAWLSRLDLFPSLFFPDIDTISLLKMQKLRWSVKYHVTKGSFSYNPEQNCSFSFTTLRLSYHLAIITHFYFSTEADFFFSAFILPQQLAKLYNHPSLS